jgi:hypothetical protein
MPTLTDIKLSSAVQVTMGVDPGNQGALAVLIGDAPVIYPTPLIKVKVGNKWRPKYDIEKIWGFLKSFSQQSVIFVIEKVNARFGESPVSAFAFGKSVAYWEMAAVAAGFEVHEVSPVEWKDHYTDLLDTLEINDLRESIHALKAKSKVVKDKKQLNRIKTEVATLNRQLKSHAKDAARAYAAKLYPDVADCFKLKKQDGSAEALLLAKYANFKYRGKN